MALLADTPPASAPPSPGDDSPITSQYRRDMERGDTYSQYAGTRPMPLEVRRALLQFDLLMPDNRTGRVARDPRERGLVFHDDGPGRDLRAGPVSVGTPSSVDVPPDISRPTARLNVHSHPYTGQHFHAGPSLGDHLVARRYPQVQHIVQTPEFDSRLGANVYMTYDGDYPPRHFQLVHGSPPASPPTPAAPSAPLPAAASAPEPGRAAGDGRAPKRARTGG